MRVITSMLAVLCVIAAARPAAADDLLRMAWDTAGNSIALRPLDDPANPYLGQYGEWDHWFYEHIDQGTSSATWWEQVKELQPAQRSAAQDEKMEYLLTAAVDAKGFLIPVLHSDNELKRTPGTLREAFAEQLRRPSAKAAFTAYARGMLTRSEYEDWQREELKRRAALYPPIPAWLARNPPARAAFPPTGEILVLGELGAIAPGTDWVTSRRLEALLDWHRYTAEGELLEVVDNDSAFADWKEVYWRGLRQFRENAFSQGTSTNHQGAYIFVAGPIDDLELAWGQQDAASVSAVYDYRGQRIEPDSAPDPRLLDMHYDLLGEQVTEYFSAQVELGLTDPQARSPYEGAANGPRVQRGEALRDAVLAWKSSDGSAGSDGMIRVRGLDDVDNPYRGLYSEWDHWIIANAGRQDPALSMSSSEKSNTLYREADTARNEGLSLEQFKAQQQQKLVEEAQLVRAGSVDEFSPRRTEHWQNIESAVDSEGWLIPLEAVWQNRMLAPAIPLLPQANAASRSWGDAHYRILAGGVIDPVEFAEYQRAPDEAEAALLPAIPQWLYDEPVYRAFIGPNAEWISWGARGDYDPAVDLYSAMRAWHKAPQRQYCRYSAQGELLQTIEGELRAWSMFYAPKVLGAVFAKYEEREDVEIYPWQAALYVLQYDREEYVRQNGEIATRRVNGRVLEAYDWMGRPVAESAPPRLDGWIGYELDGGSLRRYYEAQQRLREQGWKPQE